MTQVPSEPELDDQGGGRRADEDASPESRDGKLDLEQLDGWDESESRIGGSNRFDDVADMVNEPEIDDGA